MAKIASISDLHLGPKDNCIDIFKHDQTKFVKFLKYLESNFEYIIINGDLFETLFSLNKKKALFGAIENHKEIWGRLSNTKKYIYIAGNHDSCSKSYLGAKEDLILNIDGVKIYASHGHLGDLLQNKLQLISELGVYLGGCMIRSGLNKLYDCMYSWDIASSFESQDILKKISKGGIKLAQKYNADIILNGHSHLGGVSEHNGKLYMNSGTCTGGLFSFLSLDTAAGDYRYNLINF